jgi:ribosome assembly protein RRB1
MKRLAPEDDDIKSPLKNGAREIPLHEPEDIGEFEDEFEDEYESEDEILEAGVDGRPDEEREAEERERMLPS